MSAQFTNPTVTGPMKILIVSDGSDDSGVVEKILNDKSTGRFDLVRAHSLADAFDRLDTNRFQAILFDDNMERSEGSDVLTRIRQYKPTLPVLVLFSGEMEDARLKMLKERSHGYIAKRHITSHLLTYAICSAMQIHALQQELQGARWREYQERRTRILERLTGSPHTAVNAHNAAASGMKDAHPGKLGDLARRYAELLEMALNQEAPAREISDGLRTVAEELGAMKASPKDLLDIHGNALGIKSCGVTARKAEECAEEGRLLLIEAMGYLASYYRNYSSYAMSVINSISPNTRRTPSATVPARQAVLS